MKVFTAEAASVSVPFRAFISTEKHIHTKKKLRLDLTFSVSNYDTKISGAALWHKFYFSVSVCFRVGTKYPYSHILLS